MQTFTQFLAEGKNPVPYSNTKALAAWLQVERNAEALIQLDRALNDWVLGQTAVGYRKDIVDAMNSLFPSGHPFAVSGTVYRLWFEQYSTDYKNYASFQPRIDKRAGFSSHCRTVDGVLAIAKKYKVYNDAVITKVTIGKDGCFLYIPKFVAWCVQLKKDKLLAKHYTFALTEMMSRIIAEDEVLVHVHAMDGMKSIAFIDNRSIYTKDKSLPQYLK